MEIKGDSPNVVRYTPSETIAFASLLLILVSITYYLLAHQEKFISADESSLLAEIREKEFTDSLKFSIDVKSQKAVPDDWPTFTVEGKFQNVSGRSYALNKTLRASTQDIDADIFFYLQNDEITLGPMWAPSRRIGPLLSVDSFVLLLPGSHKTYTWDILVPNKIFQNKTPINLSKKRFLLFASFTNYAIGYPVFPEMYFQKSKDYAQDIFYPVLFYIDMNRWIGSIESNKIEVVLP